MNRRPSFLVFSFILSLKSKSFDVLNYVTGKAGHSQSLLHKTRQQNNSKTLNANSEQESKMDIHQQLYKAELRDKEDENMHYGLALGNLINKSASKYSNTSTMNSSSLANDANIDNTILFGDGLDQWKIKNEKKPKINSEVSSEKQEIKKGNDTNENLESKEEQDSIDDESRNSEDNEKLSLQTNKKNIKFKNRNNLQRRVIKKPESESIEFTGEFSSNKRNENNKLHSENDFSHSKQESDVYENELNSEFKQEAF